jgi:hypothetical protein
MTTKYLVAELKHENGKSVFVASDETLDRSGEVVPMDSWDLNNYLKNPVLLVDHDYRVENIVGLATNLSVSGGKLTFEPLLHNITPLSQQVNEMIEKGFLNSVSVGFLPHGPQGDGERVKNELLEISFVPVGANPNALRLNSIKSVAIPEEKKKEIEKWLTKQNEVLELQRIEFEKKTYKDEESVVFWLTENKYNKGEISENKDVFINKYFDVDKCADGSMKEIDIGDGVKMIACRTGVRATPTDQVKAITEELEMQVKEGRVLSGRNRKQIEDAVSLLKQTSEALSSLLELTDPKKDAGKSRETKVEPVISLPLKRQVGSRVVRALQKINKESNLLLSELKD